MVVDIMGLIGWQWRVSGGAGIDGQMSDGMPKYALTNGREAAFIEAVPHAFSDGAACVFEDGAGNRQYVSETE